MSQEFNEYIKSFVTGIETKFAAELQKNEILTDKLEKETIKVGIANGRILKLEEENVWLKAQIDKSSGWINEKATLQVRITRFKVFVGFLARGVVADFGTLLTKISVISEVLEDWRL